MRVLRHVPYMILAILLALTASCEHKELCYRHPHTAELNLVFDWSDAPEANPGSMCVYFYPEETDEMPYVFYITGNRGTTLYLPGGTYKVIAYNNDTDGVAYGATDYFETHYLHTRDTSIIESISMMSQSIGTVPRPAASADQRVVITPNQMWGCATTGITVDTTAGTTQTIILRPHLLTCNYTFEIRNVKNLQYAARISAAISGMSGSLRVHTELTDPEPVTFPLSVNRDSSTIYGQFHTFGYNAETDALKQMMLYVWCTDGSRHAYGTDGDDHFNVTRQVVNAPDPRNVHIIIDGIELHKPDESDSGGFSPSVDDWDDEEATIHL